MSVLLPPALYSNPVWHSLTGAHRHLAVGEGAALRYPRDVAPFAAVADAGPDALAGLHALLAPHESVWVFLPPDAAPVDGLAVETTLECLQMALPGGISAPPIASGLVVLGASAAPEMVALTDLAFPGFFRPRTHEMGRYLGARVDGTLVAMGGERMHPPGHPELSGICTHPDHRGRGLSTAILWRLVREQRREGGQPWLHVAAGNDRAIGLYAGIGFQTVRRIALTRLTRRE